MTASSPPADPRRTEAGGGVVGKLVSGGQTGADRAALDVAIELGLTSGGWVPRGRRAEDGAIPARYRGLVETESEAYECRTRLNVRDSDATLVFHRGKPTGGTALTLEIARSLGKPCLALDLKRLTFGEAAARARSWLAQEKVRVLNVAGPRASGDAGMADAVAAILRLALRRSGS